MFAPGGLGQVSIGKGGKEGRMYGGGSVLYFDRIVIYVAVCVCQNLKNGPPKSCTFYCRQISPQKIFERLNSMLA